MSDGNGEAPFSWGFLRRLPRWGRIVGLLAAALGGVLLRDPRFVVSCALGTGADTFSLDWLVNRARERAGDEDSVPADVGALIAARLGLKAVLLLAAFAAPGLLSLSGMAVGVLSVDLALVTVAPLDAALRTFRPFTTFV